MKRSFATLSLPVIDFKHLAKHLKPVYSSKAGLFYQMYVDKKQLLTYCNEKYGNFQANHNWKIFK